MNSFSAIQSYNRDLFGWLSTTNMYTVNKQNYDSYSLSAFYAQLYIFLGDLESGKQFIDNFISIYQKNGYLFEHFDYRSREAFPHGSQYDFLFNLYSPLVIP